MSRAELPERSKEVWSDQAQTAEVHRTSINPEYVKHLFS